MLEQIFAVTIAEKQRLLWRVLKRLLNVLENSRQIPVKTLGNVEILPKRKDRIHIRYLELIKGTVLISFDHHSLRRAVFPLLT